MGQTNHSIFARAAFAIVLAVPFSALQPAVAADGPASEREQLAALARQLNLIDRLAEHAANTAPQERARYHFDYVRLRADLQRVRAGLQDYLVPRRAQPRDPSELAGDYRTERASEPLPATTAEGKP